MFNDDAAHTTNEFRSLKRKHMRKTRSFTHIFIKETSIPISNSSNNDIRLVSASAPMNRQHNILNIKICMSYSLLAIHSSRLNKKKWTTLGE